MHSLKWLGLVMLAAILVFVGTGIGNPVSADPPTPPATQSLPNMGQQITPLAPEGSRFEPLDPELAYDPAFPGGQGWHVDHAVTTVVSPDNKTLLILTSGYNRVFTSNVQAPPSTPPFFLQDSTEYVFIYDI